MCYTMGHRDRPGIPDIAGRLAMRAYVRTGRLSMHGTHGILEQHSRIARCYTMGHRDRPDIAYAPGQGVHMEGDHAIHAQARHRHAH